METLAIPFSIGPGYMPVEDAADSRPDSRTGSLLFEVDIWMWSYRQTFPREISVSDAKEIRKKRIQEPRDL